MEFIKQLFGVGIVAGLVALTPMVLVGWILNRRRIKFKAAALEPFTDLPLRPPGESLRLKIQDLNDEFDSHFTVAAMISLGASAFAIALRPSSPGWGLTVSFLGFIVVAAWGWTLKQLWPLQKKLWDYRLGFTGERVVGEALNQLLADGFLVFHDVLFEDHATRAKFNLDHVIVGPPGVYVVETKTRRKPAALSGNERATVMFDGEMLHFPTGSDSHGVKQASDNAATLSKWLSSSTGEPTPVQAILTLPGWWIERKSKGRVAVLNPKEIRYSFPTRVAEPLSQERIQRIAHQLTERCRLEKPV